MRLFLRALPLFVLFALTACNSHVITVTIHNNSGADLRNVEVQYPGGSYGVSTLKVGATHQYRIKTLHPGPLSISFTDASGASRTQSGLQLPENGEGSISIEIADRNVVLTPHIRP